MRPIRSATVLLPTWQAMEFLERVLDALATQVTSLTWDVIAIDSGSTDGTFECLARRSVGFPVPFRFRSIPSAAFDHGDTRNLLASRTQADLLVFLTQDAIPAGPRWLDALARNFEDPRIGAAYCRNVPRPDCWPLTRAACQDDPGYSPRRVEVTMPVREEFERLNVQERRLHFNFNDVASAIRRELWERHPFPRTMMGEDVLIARGLMEAGYTIAYDPDSAVLHSHDYETPKLHWRGKVDAKFNAEWFDWVLVRRAEDVAVLAQRLTDADLARLADDGATPEECAASAARALELRTALVEGMYEGSRAPRRYSTTRMREDGRVRVLQIDTAGQDALSRARAARALAVGAALLDRGHSVISCSLTRGPRSTPLENLATPTQHGGLRAFELEVSDDADGRALLSALFERVRPDVVHVRGEEEAAAIVVEAAWLAGVPVALALDRCADSQTPSSERLGLAAASADLCLVPSVALHRRVLAHPHFARLEPHRLVCSSEGADADEARAVSRTRASCVRFGVTAPDVSTAIALGLVDVARAIEALGEGVALLRVHLCAPEQPELALDAELRGLAIEWVHGQEPRDVAADMASLDAFVTLPRQEVGIGALVAGALMCGTPVIAIRGRGGDELILEGRDGLVVADGDSGALADALARFAGGAEQHAQIQVAREQAPTFAEEILELEFRYRGMACLERDRLLPARVVYEAPGRALHTEGPAELQGDMQVLLRPTAKVLFDAAQLPPGPFEVEVTQLELGSEPGIALGASLCLDGQVVAAYGPLREPPRRSRSLFARVRRRLFGPPREGLDARHPAPPDREVTTRLRGWARDHGPSLTLEAGAFHARIVRVRVASLASPQPTPQPQSSNPHLRAAERLRVVPGPPVPDEVLPTLAVVIPTLDGREVLEGCLASLAQARYPVGRVRWVIVDNASTDGTIELLQRTHPAAQVVALDRNHGFARACNLGAEAAGDATVLVFLNNDMRVDPEFLVELVAPIAREECRATVAKRLSWDGATLDGAGVGSTFAGIAVQPGFGAALGPEHDVPRRTLFPCGGAMAIDAATFRDVGGFDEEFFAYYEDLDLGWRMWIMGHPTHYVPTAVAYHHHSHTSRRFPEASLRRVMIRNSLIACVKNYSDENLARVLPVVLALATRRAWLATGLDSAQHRIEETPPSVLAASGARAETDAPIAIQGLGVGDLAALNDLLGRFDFWLERRRAVQARRVLPDSEIFPMFLEPLTCVEGDAGYRMLQEQLLQLYRVPELFEVPEGA